MAIGSFILMPKLQKDTKNVCLTESYYLLKRFFSVRFWSHIRKSRQISNQISLQEILTFLRA